MLQKIPERLEVVAELPRAPSGKVLKQELKRRYSNTPAVDDRAR
jgi:acyl-CoA synthetase (AMP-forming)/AMP-acid ligase II